MTDYNRVDSSNLNAIRSDGTPTLASRLGAPSTWGVTLASGQTYYFPFGASKSPVPAEVPLTAVQIRGGAALVATITIEDTIFPSTVSPGDGGGVADVSDFEATGVNWVSEQPTDAYVPVSGAGWAQTASTMTVTVAGGAAGAALFHLGNFGTRRGRLKIVVTTGDLVRVGVHGKAGG